MSMGGSPKMPEPAPPPPPPAAPAPEAPLVGDTANGRRKQTANRQGTSALRTDLMIVPGAAGLGGTQLNTGG